MGTPDPVSKRLELHNTWLVSHNALTHLPVADDGKADGLKHYVDWAAAQGFGVIDVNIPKNLIAIEVCTSVYPSTYLALICPDIFHSK